MDESIRNLYEKHLEETGGKDLIDNLLLELIREHKSGISQEELEMRMNVTSLVQKALDRLSNAGLVKGVNGIYKLDSKLLMKNIPIGEYISGAAIDKDLPDQLPSEPISSREATNIPPRKRTKIDDMRPRMTSSIQDRIDQNERPEAVKDDFDIDSLLDDALGESIEDFVSDLPDLPIDDSNGGIIQPLVNVLTNTGYIQQGQDPNSSDDYKLMSLIVTSYPIATDEIEAQLSTDSLSLSLSNLTADGLIQQTNDYRYTITKKLYKILKDFIESSSTEEKIDDDSRLFERYINDKDRQFVFACSKLHYVDKTDLGFDKYNEYPEFEVLNIVRLRQPVSSGTVKEMVNFTLPVVVSRMLSRLLADGVITTDMNDNYLTTSKLLYYMTRDKLEMEMHEDDFEMLRNKYET